MKNQPDNMLLRTPALGGRDGASVEDVASAQDGNRWSYAGDSGPQHWGELASEFCLCSCGTSQSPIDVRQTKLADASQVVFHYGASHVGVTVINYTLQAKLNNHDNWIDVDGAPYELVQFHFHAPSEHTIAGASYPAELHLVHQNRAGDMAVVGVMMKIGLHNSTFAPIWDEAFARNPMMSAEGAGEECHCEVAVDIARLLPAARGMYRYSGSLTTPPCTEGIAWIVMEAPVEMSSEQLGLFTAHFPPNNRPLQPLNGREVIKYVR